MASTVSDTSAYYKVFKGLHFLIYEALPCVDNAIKVWHKNKRRTLPSCTGQCPDGRKPKLPVSCQRCVDWGNAIETALYQPPVARKLQITWQNVSSSNLGKSYIEVAKGYVLRLPKNKASHGTSQYTRLSDFDSASILMIMAAFKEFHGGNQTIYETITKVRTWLHIL